MPDTRLGAMPQEPVEDVAFEVPESHGISDPHAALRVFDAMRAKLRRCDFPDCRRATAGLLIMTPLALP